ncbi:MAG TPA: hypothetical protein PLA88_09785 [Bacteroidales bacterium]|nr:hypothetical protein [Bacteroidales bacterium]
MANKRGIKKDVNYLTNEVLVDGIMLMSLYNEKDGEMIMKELEKVAEKRNQVIDTLQHPEKKFDRLPVEERKNGRIARSKAFRKAVNDKFTAFEDALDAAYESFGKLAKEEK